MLCHNSSQAPCLPNALSEMTLKKSSVDNGFSQGNSRVGQDLQQQHRGIPDTTDCQDKVNEQEPFTAAPSGEELDQHGSVTELPKVFIPVVCICGTSSCILV